MPTTRNNVATIGIDADDTLSQSEHFQTDISPQTYTRIFSQHGDGPARAVIVGNSLKSDIVPTIAAGSWGVFIAHTLT